MNNPVVRQLSSMDKIKLIRILAEELDTFENQFLFEPHKTYDLPTPYDAFGAAEILMTLLKSAETEANS